MGFPNGGRGSPTWEKFPHFPVFLGGERPLAVALAVAAVVGQTKQQKYNIFDPTMNI